MKTTNTPITETPMGHTSYATSPRKTTKEMVDNNMQKVGMREDKEKNAYESYTSRERYYSEQQYQYMRTLGQKSTHDESLQINPIITQEEPYITSNSKTTCGAAGSNGAVSMGVDPEDGIRGDCKYGCVRPNHCL